MNRARPIPTTRPKSSTVARWLLVIVVVAFAAALLSGCHEQPITSAGKDTNDVSGNGFSAYVRDVVTPAGVRCVVMTGLDRGGISCDWEHAQLSANSTNQIPR